MELRVGRGAELEGTGEVVVLGGRRDEVVPAGTRGDRAGATGVAGRQGDGAEGLGLVVIDAYVVEGGGLVETRAGRVDPDLAEVLDAAGEGDADDVGRVVIDGRDAAAAGSGDAAAEVGPEEGAAGGGGGQWIDGQRVFDDRRVAEGQRGEGVVGELRVVVADGAADRAAGDGEVGEAAAEPAFGVAIGVEFPALDQGMGGGDGAGGIDLDGLRAGESGEQGGGEEGGADGAGMAFCEVHGSWL